MSGDAGEDARTIRGRGVLLIVMGLWVGGAVFAHAALGGGRLVVWVILAVGIALVPYCWLAFGIPPFNPEPGARTRADRVQTIASAVTFLLVMVSLQVKDLMTGVLWFRALAAVVLAAPSVVAGAWALREASAASAAPRSDERPTG